jgi:hypothetical protein
MGPDGTAARITPGARLGDVVTWTIEPGPSTAGLRRVRDAVASAVASVLGAASGLAAYGPRDPAVGDRLPRDPDRQVYLGGLCIDTGSPWTPAEPGEGARPLLVNQRVAWTGDLGSTDAARLVPLESLHVVRAEPEGRDATRSARSRWRLVVSDGSHEVGISGTWLALAYLGALAGWPEPPRS